MGIAVYSENVTKKSYEKRVSMLTHRELSIAKNKIKNSNHLRIYIIEPYEKPCEKPSLFITNQDGKENINIKI